MPPVMRPPRRGVSYSEGLARAYASNPEDEIVLDTLEFLHSTFLDDDGNPMGIRVVNDHSLLTATLEPDAPLNAGQTVGFQPVYFTMKRQDESESGAVPQITIQVDNVGQILIPYLDRAKESRDPIQVIWRPYLADDLSGPHMIPVLMLTLTKVGGNMSSLAASAGFSELTNRRFPASEYTSKKFPGLTIR